MAKSATPWPFADSARAFWPLVRERWAILLLGLIGGIFGTVNELFFGGSLKMSFLVGWSLFWVSVVLAVFLAFHDYRTITSKELAGLREPRRKVPLDFHADESMRNDPNKPVASFEELAESEIRGKVVFVTEIPEEGEAVRGKVFTDCDLWGPAVIVFGPGCECPGLSLATDEIEPEAILWEVPGWKRATIGTLRFESCRFLRCRLFGIGIAGQKPEMDYWRSTIPKDWR